MSDPKDALKQQAAAAAVRAEVRSGMRLGLGTGSTAAHMVRLVGELLARGELRDIVGVPTSQATADLARSLGIPLSDLNETPELDVTIDGYDEFDAHLNLIKGLGGALLREKIVAASTRRLAVIGTLDKQVTHLGERAPVPVEVITMAAAPVRQHLEQLGAVVTLRRARDGGPFQTDEGNLILDARFAPIEDPAALARAIRDRPGVVEHGMFLDMARVVYAAEPTGVRIFQLKEKRGGSGQIPVTAPH